MSKNPKLSKRILARTKTVEFTWIRCDFMAWSTFSEYRKDKTKCWWCKHPFEGDEMLALAGRSKGRNVLLCQECAGVAVAR